MPIGSTRVVAALAILAMVPALVATAGRAPTSRRPDIEAIVRQFHVNFSNDQVERNGALVADNLVVNLNGGSTNRPNGATFRGRAAFVAWLEGERSVFADGRITDHDVLVSGNKAAIRFTFDGTQTGPLPTARGTLPATGRKIHIDGTEFFTFDERGKLIHLETFSDDLALQSQLAG